MAKKEFKESVKLDDNRELVDIDTLTDEELKALDVEDFEDFKISFGCPRFENVPDEKQRNVMQALFVLRCALDNMERLLKYDGEVSCYQAWCVQIVANVLFDVYGFLKP